MSNKLQLPQVQLVAVAGNKQAETIASLYKSMAKIDFHSVKLITNINISCSGIECVNVGGLGSWEEYNRFIIKDLYQHLDANYFLLQQYDSWVLDEKQWDDRYFEYDYVAAKWLDIGKPYNVGNGGFKLSTKRLHKILSEDENIITTCPEDTAIVKVYGQYLMDKYGIKFAPEDLADKFAFELNEPMASTFGFHSWHWPPFKETVVIKRDFALGDVLMTEPIMHYFHKKGYQVALETSDENMAYFKNHFYRIVPKQHLNPNLPVRVIDLNMAYEVFPRQNHLESYYDFAEVPKEERVYRNPILCLNFDFRSPQFKLFKNYCVLHIDERSELHRNLYGIDWAQVVAFLKDKGYTVVQVGNGKHETVEGAIEIKTPWPDMLMWVVASSDLFIGIDSGVSHVASGFNVPSVILSGSVDMNLIHSNLTNKLWIHRHNEKVCDTPLCWHQEIGQSAPPCPVNPTKPPCVQFDTDDVISKIDNFLLTKTPIHTEDARNIK